MFIISHNIRGILSKIFKGCESNYLNKIEVADDEEIIFSNYSMHYDNPGVRDPSVRDAISCGRPTYNSTIS